MAPLDLAAQAAFTGCEGDLFRGGPKQARCGRCGCRLSRYRSEEELVCWSCAHRELPAPERERRVLLYSAGALPPIIPAPEFVCRDCGGVKTAGAERCARCRFGVFHPKTPAVGAFPRTGPCPVCGLVKNAKARLCRSCWVVDQRLLFATNRVLTCPDCGGAKVRKAERCRRCHNSLAHGTVYLDGRPSGYICPDCGGPKQLKRAARCRTCAVRHRREQVSTAAVETRRGEVDPDVVEL
jgi:hypothetical protein